MGLSSGNFLFQPCNIRLNLCKVNWRFFLKRVNIARNVEVVLIAPDFFKGRYMGEFLYINTIYIGIDNILNVFLPKLVLILGFDVSYPVHRRVLP